MKAMEREIRSSKSSKAMRRLAIIAVRLRYAMETVISATIVEIVLGVANRKAISIQKSGKPAHVLGWLFSLAKDRKLLVSFPFEGC